MYFPGRHEVTRSMLMACADGCDPFHEGGRKVVTFRVAQARYSKASTGVFQ
jgi:hypothetical protein